MNRIHIRAILLFALIIIGLAGGAYNLSKALEPKIDLFWIMSIGNTWFGKADGDTPQPIGSNVIANETGEAVESRSAAVWNYPAFGVLSFIAGHLHSSFFVRSIFAFSAFYLIAFGIAFWGFRVNPVASALFLSFYGLLGFLPGPIPTDDLFHYAVGTNILNFFSLIGNSGEVFSPLSVWPRTLSLLLFAAALLARWGGKKYWPIVLSILPVHLFFGVVAIVLFFFKSPKSIVALCLLGALAFIAIHFSGLPFATLTSQIATRYLMLAETTLVIYACQWASSRVSEREVTVLATICAVMTVYGAIGSWWQLGIRI